MALSSNRLELAEFPQFIKNEFDSPLDCRVLVFDFSSLPVTSAATTSCWLSPASAEGSVIGGIAGIGGYHEKCFQSDACDRITSTPAGGMGRQEGPALRTKKHAPTDLPASGQTFKPSLMWFVYDTLGQMCEGPR